MYKERKRRFCDEIKNVFSTFLSSAVLHVLLFESYILVLGFVGIRTRYATKLHGCTLYNNVHVQLYIVQYIPIKRVHSAGWRDANL